MIGKLFKFRAKEALQIRSQGRFSSVSIIR